MKTLPEPDFNGDHTEFRFHYSSLMQRPLKAGLITRYEEDPGPDGELVVAWNQHYQKGMSGGAAFLGLATLLADLCRERPLSDDEQALIQIFRHEYWEKGGAREGNQT